MLQKRIEYDTGSISIRKNPVTTRKGNLTSMGSDDLVAEKLGDLHRWVPAGTERSFRTAFRSSKTKPTI